MDEEQVNQILERVQFVLNSILQAPQQVSEQTKQRYQETINSISEYLSSTNLEELNPEGIQQDLTKLLKNPQEGAQAWRDRLSQFDRDTLVAVISSREDISEEQANQIVLRIEQARDNVLHQAELIQQETQKRLNAVKKEAKRQAKDARKAVTDAAWWLFGAASTSFVASAIAGFVAVNY